jgi:hypothetical protein
MFFMRTGRVSIFGIGLMSLALLSYAGTTNIFVNVTLTNGLFQLEINYSKNPLSASTNGFEIYESTNLFERCWHVHATNILTSTNGVSFWTDSNTTRTLLFYVAGNADIDTDSDGLNDAREQLIYKTSELSIDTDLDGFTDYEELMTHHTNPNNDDANKPILSITLPSNVYKIIWEP